MENYAILAGTTVLVLILGLSVVLRARDVVQALAAAALGAFGIVVALAYDRGWWAFAAIGLFKLFEIGYERWSRG